MFVAHPSHWHRFATVRTVTAARVDPVEMAEEEHGCTRWAGDRFDRTPILPDVHEKIEFVHQLRQLVNHTAIIIIIILMLSVVPIHNNYNIY